MTKRAERTVYQFPISHYCEKTRWNLDAKRLDYKVHNLAPGLHTLILRVRSRARTVPVLVDGETTVGDSTAIALYLERAYPDPPLLPRDEQARARALELEDFFDESMGLSMRQLLYGKLMEERPGSAAAALFKAYPLPVRLFGKLIAPGLEKAIQKRERIDQASIERARDIILRAADRLEQEIGGDPRRYLVGDSLTLADITAASLFAPLVAPPGSPYVAMLPSLPPYVDAVRRSLRERALGQWVVERYRRDRELSGAGPRGEPRGPEA